MADGPRQREGWSPCRSPDIVGKPPDRHGLGVDVGRVWACQDGSNNLRPTIRNVANVTSGWDCVRFYPSNQRTRQTNAPAEQAFVAKRTAQPEWAPERTLTASFALGNRRGRVFATYSFDTVAFGVPGSREAETARLVRWAETAGPLVKRGFENGSTTPAPAF